MIPSFQNNNNKNNNNNQINVYPKINIKRKKDKNLIK